MQLDCFREIWLVDFEFYAPDGQRQEPLCLVAREWRTGRLWRYWRDALDDMPQPPYATSPDVLFVAYYASAELRCHLQLGWPMPRRILDLFAEFKCLRSGLGAVCGFGLLGALAHYGLGAIEAIEKDTMRELAMRGGSYSTAEREALLDYCQTDVDALARLLPAMMPDIDLPRALLRGRYMAAAAHIEWTGTPIDMPTFHQLRQHWPEIQDQLITKVDREYGIYDGRTFKRDRWADYLARHDIPWPRLESGTLDLSDDVFRQMAKLYPSVGPIRELRYSLSKLRLSGLTVGRDGRNRCLLGAFGSRTGRNQPSNAKFIFGPSVWLRGLIKPQPGMAIAYIDYEQQEFGIAAALSGDKAMMAAYESGDPYLAFAKQARAAPEDATKASHRDIRDQFKVCALAVQYGMAAKSLAQSLNESEARARQLLQLHRQTYPVFWEWSGAARDEAMLLGKLHTVFGWQVHVSQKANPRSLMNFPMQANGAEMLRLACCHMTEAGIAVCAPVHDAVLVEGPIDEIDDVVARSAAMMQEASEMVLSGLPLRSEAKIVRYPDRYMDERGGEMWQTVMDILEEVTPAACPAVGQVECVDAVQTPRRDGTPAQSHNSYGEI